MYPVSIWPVVKSSGNQPHGHGQTKNKSLGADSLFRLLETSPLFADINRSEACYALVVNVLNMLWESHDVAHHRFQLTMRNGHVEMSFPSSRSFHGWEVSLFDNAVSH